MSEDELSKFIGKVNQLNDLIASLDTFPERRKEIASCDNHEQVVSLAKTWGFDIGRRWGDKP
ncbi:Nif11 family protein [Prochlorococcus marinus]|uniref:Nif11 family protein n=1 Tax=Prochlorococcus marinus TaxID=1219 RepID=UPI0022B31054|nr:Nif11 family protein [Prochlorococcus marinus]